MALFDNNNTGGGGAPLFINADNEIIAKLLKCANLRKQVKLWFTEHILYGMA